MNATPNVGFRMNYLGQKWVTASTIESEDPLTLHISTSRSEMCAFSPRRSDQISLIRNYVLLLVCI